MLEATTNAIQLQDISDSLFDRIAKLVSMEVPARQISMATGVSSTKIAEVIGNQEVVKRVEKIATENLEKADLVNTGWDAVEEEALGTVLEQLQVNQDKEFALKAAAVANKAQRRGNGNQSISDRPNATATIELNIAYIEKLQTMSIEMPLINKNAKRVDTLNVQDTQHLFRATGEKSIDEIFDTVTIDSEAMAD